MLYNPSRGLWCIKLQLDGYPIMMLSLWWEEHHNTAILHWQKAVRSRYLRQQAEMVTRVIIIGSYARRSGSKLGHV